MWRLLWPLQLWLLLLVWMCGRSACSSILLLLCGCWKNQDDHNNTQRDTRAVYECVRVFRTQWDDGVRVQIQPQTDDLALTNDPGVILGWGKDLKGYRKWFEGKTEKAVAKGKSINTEVYIKHTYFSSHF